MRVNRLAIIGLGSIGRRHLRLVSEIRPDIEIIVVRSGHGYSCREEKEATKIVYSINEAIQEGIQAAIISSPTTLHLKQSLELAKNGVHLLIEKPLSHTLDKVDELLKVIIENRVVAMVGYVLRYDPGAIKFKDWLSNKLKGRILHARIECGSYLPDWRPDQDYRKTVSASHELGGGVLLELSHELDYLHWFFGRPTDVQAKMKNSETLDINVEDQADLILTSSEGYPITLQLDFNRRNPKRICSVLTTEGELTWDAIEKNVICRMINNEPVIYKYSNERNYIYRKQIELFLDCIEKDIDPKVSIYDGAEVMRLIDAARYSDEKGCKITL
jgi:predicted dehydrogenase